MRLPVLVQRWAHRFQRRTAAKLYERQVIPTLNEAQRSIPKTILPSTSPAHAGIPLEEKANPLISCIRRAPLQSIKGTHGTSGRRL